MGQFQGSRPLAAPYGLSCASWVPTLMDRSDKHREVEINLITSGTLRYWLGGAQAELQQDQAAVFWADVPHQITGFTPDCSYFVVTIPVSSFLQWNLPEDFVKAILHGRLLMYDFQDRIAFESERFGIWEQELANHAPDSQAIFQLEIRAWLLRLAARIPLEPVPSTNQHSRGAVLLAEQIAGFVTENATRPISVQTLSEHFSLHPNSVMRLFKRVFGCSLGQYITEVRIFHAQRLLATTDELIQVVALESGFNSMSRFNQAFRKTLGCSPRDYRNGSRQWSDKAD